MAALRGRRRVLIRLTLATVLGLATLAAAETVTLKTGEVYRGNVDKDNTIVSVFDTDGTKRVIFRDSKIAAKFQDEGMGKTEIFALVQPMVVHGGAMPLAAFDVKATPWDLKGRRTFKYTGPSGGKPVEMEQAINKLGPRVCGIRGIDGFWVTQIATSTVPRATILDILGKVDQKLQNERLRVVRFLIQADYYSDAKREVQRYLEDFGKTDPAVAGQCKNALEQIRFLESQQALTELEVRGKAQQPQFVSSGLKSFPTEGAPPAILVSIRDQLRKDEAQSTADKELIEAVRRNIGEEGGNKLRLTEIVAGLIDAPDAVRVRFDAFEKARSDGTSKPAVLAALALSGWILGGDGASPDVETAESLWKARSLMRDYLGSSDMAIRSSKLESLEAMTIGGKPLSLDTLGKMVQLMPPPLRDAQEILPGKPRELQVNDELNPGQPTKYAVLLPPEYHPLRNYPTVVALHGDETPMEALNWWASEAARRGYIVIAPEYSSALDQKRDYRYSVNEHAAVTLAIRDARRRFSIDSDRVFLGGTLCGGDMAWDYGLAHPDVFAGIVAISGLPAKFVWSTRANAPRVPLYVVMGDLSPAETEVFFDRLAKPMIIDNNDITYVEYYRRGREDFPEEANPVFNWMAARRRDPIPRKFTVVSARECDDRFYGVVVREFAEGRTKDPSVVDPMGKNLKPARIEFSMSKIANPQLLALTTPGVTKLDVWVSPKLFDFTKKLEVRVNNRSVFRGPAKPDMEAFLEDLRIRGDRSQTYWMKVPISLIGGRN